MKLDIYSEKYNTQEVKHAPEKLGSGLSKVGTKITKTAQKLTRGPVGDFTNNIAQEFK